LKKDEELTFLFDICSGSQLPRCDIGRDSDPYVSVRFKGKKIHKTDHIPSSANPIWTLRKGSLFIWKVDALELFESEDGVVFEVKDYDLIGHNDSVGGFNVDARTLYKWNGERREFALKPLLGQKDRGKDGRIYLRVRRATDYDIDFMEKHNQKTNHKIAVVPTIMAGGGAIKNMMAVHSKKGMSIFSSMLLHM
jgi:Ca2+-dependent lipid-binding protein